VAIYEPLGPKEVSEAVRQIAANSRRLARYQAQDWDAAESAAVNSTPARVRCTMSTSSASRISAKCRRPLTGTASSSTQRNKHDKNNDETHHPRLQRRHRQRAPTTCLKVDDDI
jgi:hypothetical protein